MEDFIEIVFYLFLLVPFAILSAVFLIVYLLLVFPIACVACVLGIAERYERF